LGKARTDSNDASGYLKMGFEEPLKAGDLFLFVGASDCVGDIQRLTPCLVAKSLDTSVFECVINRNQAEIVVTQFEEAVLCLFQGVERSCKVQT
jgi:hypothetical protein